MSTALAIKDSEDGVPAGVLEAKANIIKTMKIQAEKGNKEASFILKHL